MKNGALQGPWVAPSVQCERTGAGSLEQDPLPVNSLLIMDSAYVTLKALKAHKEKGTYAMSHARADTKVTDARGVKMSIEEFLLKRINQEERVDEWVTLGSRVSSQQKVRIGAFRVSPETEKARREQSGKQSKRRKKGSRGDVRVGKKQGAINVAPTMAGCYGCLHTSMCRLATHGRDKSGPYRGLDAYPYFCYNFM